MAKKTFLLPKRIRNRKDFLRAADNGRKFRTTGFILQMLPNQTKETVRVGFTTTKKLGHAVIRNKIRRRLREMVRLIFIPQAPKGFDYVFIGRTATVDRPFELLKSDAVYVLDQISKSPKQRRADSVLKTRDKEREI